MPVKPGYADRVFSQPKSFLTQMSHIGEDKDFTPVIEKHWHLAAIQKTKKIPELMAHYVMTGFGHGTVLGVADQVIDAK